MKTSRLCMRPLVFFALSLGSSLTWAGAPITSVDYAPLPNAAAVPTLGEWTLILMALLMAVVAYRVLRGRVNGRLLSNAVLAGGAVAATIAGHGVVREVQAAITYADYEMSIPTGGTVEAESTWIKLINTSGVPLQIKAIRLPSEAFEVVSPIEQSPECKTNLIVSPSASCYFQIRFAYPGEITGG